MQLRHLPLMSMCYLAFLAAGCVAKVDPAQPSGTGAVPSTPGGPGGSTAAGGTGQPSGNGGTGASNPVTGSGGSGATGPNGTAGSGATGGAPVTNLPRDPGRVTMRQLNNTEYDNTVRDLLGTGQRYGLTFLNDAPAFALDNNADQLSISTASAGLYHKAAEALAAEALTGTARAKIVTCDLAATGDTCQRTIISNFGAKAYRRPLTTAEVSGYLALMASARTAGATADEAVRTALEAFLMSPSFLYRIEFDANPTSLVAHPIAPYEMASRLSYLIFRSMPDQALFDAAAAGKLTAPADVQAQLTRMLADGKGTAFAKDFSSLWLGVGTLENIQFDTKVFPKFNATLAASMKAEVTSVFDAFMKESLPANQLLTSRFTFVDSVLATHYGLPAVPAGAARRVELTTPQRGGLLTMAGNLAVTSYMTRTSLVKRGAWVETQLLCTEPPPPPQDIPPFPEGMVMGTQREILVMHRTNPSCTPCHVVIDNIGLALENYDGIGAWRVNDPNGGVIDASGELGGKKFVGAQELAAVVATDARFAPCMAEKMLSFALGRAVSHIGVDKPYVNDVAAATPTGLPSVREMLNRVVASDTFNMRHGEP